jgi:hypothetical protein
MRFARSAVHLDEPQMNGMKLRHIDEPQMNGSTNPECDLAPKESAFHASRGLSERV